MNPHHFPQHPAQLIQQQQHTIHYMQQHYQQLLQTAQQQLQDLQRQLQTAQTENNKLQQQSEQQQTQLRKRIIPRDRKRYRELTDSGKWRRRENIKTVLRNVCDDLPADVTGISATFEVEGHQGFQLGLRGEAGQQSQQDKGENLEEQRQEMAQKILRVKDAYRLPFKALQALRAKSGLSDIPPEKVLQAESLRLATFLQIIPMTTIPSKDGSVRPLADILTFLLDFPENHHLLLTDEQEVTITLRFACDGAKITKAKDSVRAVCKLVKPPGANYKNSPEDELSLVIYMETWSVQRNAVQQRQLLQNSDHCGYINTDLLDWIPYEDMVPDELHLRLRISNKLFNQVVVWSVCQDRRQALIDEMARIKVPFRFFEEQGDDGKGTIKKWTQLCGDDLRKVIKNLRVLNILEHAPLNTERLDKLPKHYLLKMLERKTGVKHPKATKEFVIQELHHLMSAEEKRELIANCPSTSRILVDAASQQARPQQNPAEPKILKPDKIQEIWDEFDALMEMIKAPLDSNSCLPPEGFAARAKAWAEKFKKYTFHADVIPYIHVLVYHVPEAMRRHGFLPHIGIAQVERKNYDQHLSYFQGTSKQGGRHRKKVTLQIMERENRLLYYRRHLQGEEPV